ncbi:carbohydrate-binding domain-containing protein [Buchananella hordeovulneris]|uniref:carbohydrate-binding domain-containing protein n=1 Tax=Buchananella hordeovulneris TaxID=52770 RepID=UPI0026DC7BB7|nr:carbohydrate-binding domain-containing protein [Buchananella hordeovulneris]MDO5080871.1 carbohydrate-binding domain-containing protein [Buchananella hordeovulneris]
MKFRSRPLVRIASLATAVALTLGACSTAALPQSADVASAANTGSLSPATADSYTQSTAIDDNTLLSPPSAEAALAANAAVSLVDASQWQSSPSGEVVFAGQTATSQAEGVSVSGTVTTINQPGVYRLSGDYTGQLVVDAPADALVVLIFDNLTIDTSLGSAVEIKSAANAVIVLEGNSNVADASSYQDSSAANAAIYADTNLQITGNGGLTVTGRGNDGITATDDLVIESGSLQVTAVDDALRGKDSLSLLGGSVSVKAGGDALKADNDVDTDKGYIHIAGGSLTLTAQGDALTASTDVIVTGGTVAASTAGGAGNTVAEDASAKGIKAGVYAVVAGGDLHLDAAEDAVHADGSIRLSGGRLELSAADDAVHAEAALVLDGADVEVAKSVEGLEAEVVTISDGTVSVVSSDDAINGSASTGEVLVEVTGGQVELNSEGDALDSNGDLFISGGSVVAWGPSYDDNGTVDVDGTFAVTGGSLLAAGSAGMAVSPNADGLGWVSANLLVSAGSEVIISTTAGQEIARFTAKKAFANLLYAVEEIPVGQQLVIAVDGVETTVTAGVAAGGMGPAGGPPGAPGGPAGPDGPGGQGQ